MLRLVFDVAFAASILIAFGQRSSRNGVSMRRASPHLRTTAKDRIQLRYLLLASSPSSAVPTANSVKLYFDKSLRHLLPTPRHHRVSIDVHSDAPLHSLESAVSVLLQSAVDPTELRLLHGKQYISTDEDLRIVMGNTAQHNAETALKVLPPMDASLLPNPPSEKPYEPLDEPHQMISFFNFPAVSWSTERVSAAVETIDSCLRSSRVFGTVYVATEGVNAQLAVPLSKMESVQSRLSEIILGEGHLLHFNYGESVTTTTPTFKKLIVKARKQVLTDGLTVPLRWHESGKDVSPEEWDAAVSEEDALLLDCRNQYESDAGQFENSEPLGTDTFAESWDVLRKRLEKTPRETPILTYCTGGIRCIKVNAFLEQELGFTNTRKLKDGIVGYLRHKRTHGDDEHASGDMAKTSSIGKWRGSNFVFDRRNYEYGADDPHS